MNNYCGIVFLMLFLIPYSLKAQYIFSGHVDQEKGKTAYLSLISDYRKLNGVYEEQIINKYKIDSNYFEFRGNNLSETNRFYSIHIDNCIEVDKNHFNGKCETSRQLVFLANNRDTINFPTTFEDQALCEIKSSKPHTQAIFKIDSLIELMVYDYGVYRSEANRKVNNNKWFSKLQEYGESLEEPLAELYVYQFLSNRSSDLYAYYLKDVAENSYYSALGERLKRDYPDATYSEDYELEILTDKYKSSIKSNDSFAWVYVLIGFLAISLALNFLFWKKLRKYQPKPTTLEQVKLTGQEQKILDCILENKTNKEIASEIFVSLSTVKTHINNIYKKLNVNSRDEVKHLYNK